jgi:DNA-binding NarL/FixJ family response regulator
MIRLLLVDDQMLICQGLKAMLSLESDFEVVGIASDGQQALSQVEELLPDVVLMDVQMPHLDGHAATRLIRERYPQIRVLMLSTFSSCEYISTAIQAGAQGYLLKDMPSEELAQAIRAIHQGYSQLGPGLLEKLAQVHQSTNHDVPAFSANNSEDCQHVTPREQEVLQLVRQGLTNREIAETLFISEGTVKTHVTHLLARFNLRNRSQLAIYAHSGNLEQLKGSH